MKIIEKIFAPLTLICGTILPAYSQGYIVPDGVRSTPYGGLFIFRVIQNPATGNYTEFSFAPQDATTFAFDTALDEGVRVFFMSPNDPMSLEAIQTAGYTELLYPSTYFLEDGLPFYLGLYTGEGVFKPGAIFPDPLFGWARLVNNGGVIELLDGALAYNAAGIYAGTLNIIQVPEPSTLALIGLGLLGLGWHCRQKPGVRSPTTK